MAATDHIVFADPRLAEMLSEEEQQILIRLAEGLKQQTPQAAAGPESPRAAEPTSLPKHPGGRPRKPGQVKVTLSLNSDTVTTLKLMSSMLNITRSEVVDRWAREAKASIPKLIDAYTGGSGNA